MKNVLLRLLLAVSFLNSLSDCRNRERSPTLQDKQIELELARKVLTEKLKNDREDSDERAIAALVDDIPDDTLQEWIRSDSAFAAELRRLEHRPDPGVSKSPTPGRRPGP